MRVFIGGVGQLYQGDHDLGRRFVDSLEIDIASIEVVIEDLYYGAVAVAQRLQELRPDALILVGTAQRGRAPGAVERRVVTAGEIDPRAARHSVESAVAGNVSLDLVIDVTLALRAAPPRTVAFEVEPENLGPSTTISASAVQALAKLEDLVTREVTLTPLFVLANEVAATLYEGDLDDSPAMDSLRHLLAAIGHLEENWCLGSLFTLRDRLRPQIVEGETSEDMTRLDRGPWWSLIEELDRLQAIGVDTGLEQG